jgi:hypothetical protein
LLQERLVEQELRKESNLSNNRISIYLLE